MVFLGDYIDRGPVSREVIETLLAPGRSYSPIFLRGNHEAMILEAKEDPLKENLWQSYGGLETLFSYGTNYWLDWASSIPDRHWQFFARTKRFFETESQIFVHACLDPELDMNEQPDWLLYWSFLSRSNRINPESGSFAATPLSDRARLRTWDLPFALILDLILAVG